MQNISGSMHVYITIADQKIMPARNSWMNESLRYRQKKLKAKIDNQ